jgi:high-affinity iron transporter
MQFMEVVVAAFVIFLREGIEVLLIVLTMARVARQTNPAASLLPIHSGAVAGVAINIILGLSVGLAGLHSEFADKAILLVAAALMLYVARGLLLFRFLGTEKDDRLKRRVRGTGGRPTALFMLTFLVVAREAFELLLFTEALSIKAGGWTSAIFTGIGLAALALVGVFFLLRLVAAQLPIRLIFALSSVFLIVQAAYFVWEALA